MLHSDHITDQTQVGVAVAVPMLAGDKSFVMAPTRQYNHLDHGYAATVHKAQGITCLRANISIGTRPTSG